MGTPFHWQKLCLIDGQRLIGIKLDEVTHEEIEMAVPVVIEKSAACAPPSVLLVEASLARHIGKGSVSVVMEENVATPERAEQVVPAIVVVVAHAHAGLPSGPPKSGLLGHVGEGAVAIVLEKMRGGLFPCGPVRVEPVSIGQIDVEPSVIVIVEEGDAAAFRLDDDALLVDASPDIGNIQACLLCNVDELNGRGRRSRHRGFNARSSAPCPERSCQPVEQGTAEHEKG